MSWSATRRTPCGAATGISTPKRLQTQSSRSLDRAGYLSPERGYFVLAFYPQLWDIRFVSKKIPPLPVKPLRWIGPSKDELIEFPDPVKKEMGHALHLAQTGDKADNAKPLHGFGGAGVLEIVENYASDTYRAVYTVKLAGTVYVLHCFQKKSKKGIETPKQTINLIKQRLRTAIELHETQKRSEKS